ncbi:MAG: VWA domain-containing protein [Oscillospiraceae bacterium]|nr:VWA domain-containing protein [Oscillospiraceae bacterium]
MRKLYGKVTDLTYDSPSIYDTNNSGFWYPEEDISAFLPDFDTGRLPAVNANRGDSVTAIILSSTEKATANDTDRWLIDVAEAYNQKSDRKGSITLYGIASGEAFDYIRSGKFIPDAWTPSNTLWGDPLNLKPDYERLAGNVAGIASKEGLSIEQVIERVETGNINFGYTNPFASSTGANFLLQYIYNYRNADSFADFQRNIALMSYTTLQMRSAALSGTLDAFVYESQQFATGKVKIGSETTTLDTVYTLVPFGVRHDNPFYVLNESKRALLEDFAEFALSRDMQSKATSYGFNRFDDYKGQNIVASNLIVDQKLYQENKTGGKPVVSVFVCDVSGSMDGTPLAALKESLRNAAGIIPNSNYIGFVTFADDVKVNLPIAQFDNTMRNRFLEAVSSLQTRGGTAIFSGITVALNMLIDYKEANPGTDAIYRVFVLTDGENNRGLNRNSTFDTFRSLGIPIYCIGYNNGSEDLDALAGLNEAAHIRINDQNVGYALANFFRAEF